MEFLSPHVAMIPSRQSPVSKVSFRQGRFSSRWISSVLPVIHPGIGWKRHGSNFPDRDFGGVSEISLIG